MTNLTKKELLKNFEYENALWEEGVKQREEQLRDEFRRDMRAVVTQNNGLKQILHLSSTRPQKFRITTLQADDTPSGHSVYNKLGEAIRYLAILDIYKVRPDFPETLGFGVEGEYEYIYESRLRPVGINMSPQDGLLRTEPGGKFGRLVYSRILRRSEMEHFSLKPIGFERKNPAKKSA